MDFGYGIKCIIKEKMVKIYNRNIRCYSIPCTKCYYALSDRNFDTVSYFRKQEKLKLMNDIEYAVNM